MAYCEHEYGICEADDIAEFPELTECPEGCTGVEIEDEGSSVGFSGAPIYWTNYSYGHQEVDASGDTLSVVDDIPSGTPDSWIPDNPNEDGFTRADFI